MVEVDQDLAELGPGIHVIAEPHALKRAGRVAATLRADLCATATQAEKALAARRGFDALHPDRLAHLAALAGRLARVDRMVASTTARAVEQVSERLAATGTALVVHPDTVRQRSRAVMQAREQAASAAAALAAHEQVVQAAREAAEARQREPVEAGVDEGPEDDHPRVPKPRMSSWAALALIAGVLLAGLLAVATGLMPMWLALVPTFVACLVVLRMLRPVEAGEPDDLADREAASELLRTVAAVTDDAFGARRATSAAEERRSLLTIERDRAIEEVRVAERAWSELAGDGVAVEAVDDVVRRFDPHHHDAVEVAGQTVSVRTISAVRARWVAEWEAAWAGLPGVVPAAADAVAAVAELRATYQRPIVLVGPAVDSAEDLARTAPQAVVVVLTGDEDDEDAFEVS